MNFIYRKFDLAQADMIMNYCDSNGIEYDIWNAAEILMGSQTVDIGLLEWTDEITKFVGIQNG